MISRRTGLGLAVACALACGATFATPALAVSTVQDQSDVDLSAAFAISSFLAIDDLNFPVNSRIDTVTVWLTDSAANDNGVLDGFNGYVSWALYSDSSGPSAFMSSGLDQTPELVDTGLQTASGSDVFRLRFDLDGRPIVGPGRVWLAIHEGLWGSPTDGTPIYWLASSSVAGSAAYVTANEVNPAPGEWFLALADAAFVVESDPHDWYEGFIDTQSGGNISSYVSATDFYLQNPRTIGSLDAWIGDSGPENGHLDNFSGSLSWAIYSDSAGNPGTLVASGHDATPQLLDSYLNFNSGGDIVRVRIELEPRPSLSAGTWWLALHEGSWGSADDGSGVYWLMSPAVLFSPSRQAEDETSPGSWYELFATRDLAFVLFNDSIFASGFDAGTTCAWSAAVGGATCP
jgi:hypothetical protein